MSKIIDFQNERNQRVETKRRNFERLLFKNFLGAYSVIDQAGSIYPVELVDISETGCLFQVPWNPKNGQMFASGTEINLRMYFTQTSFIPVTVKIKYGNEYVGEEGKTYIRYGSEFDTSTHSFEALLAFVKFLYKFAENSVEDKGEGKKIYFL